MNSLVVTGGAKGIGLGVAQAALKTGAQVAVFDADPTGAQIADGIGASYHQVDVSSPDSLTAAFAAVADRTGSIDGLVNSAGLTRTAPSHELSPDDWRKVIDVDLSGTFYACQAAVPHLAPTSAIVNVASIASVRALPGRAAYTAAKFGVVGVTRVLAVEWAERGIRVNAVAPAWTETPFLTDLIDAGKLNVDDLTRRIPMKRLARVDDVVASIQFLLSDAASFVTGQTLFVDGGYTWAG